MGTMNGINSIGTSLFDTTVQRALVPVEPYAPSKDSTQQPVKQQPAPITLTSDLLNRLQITADLLQKRAVIDNGATQRNRHAISSYRTLNDSEERERVSSLLGIDEYA